MDLERLRIMSVVASESEGYGNFGRFRLPGSNEDAQDEASVDTDQPILSASSVGTETEEPEDQ